MKIDFSQCKNWPELEVVSYLYSAIVISQFLFFSCVRNKNLYNIVIGIKT